MTARLKPQELGEWFLNHGAHSAKDGPCEMDNLDISERLSTAIERGALQLQEGSTRPITVLSLDLLTTPSTST